MSSSELKSKAGQIVRYGREAMQAEDIQRLDDLKDMVRTAPDRRELYYETLARVLLLAEILMTADSTSDSRRLAILGTYLRLADLMLRNAPDDSPQGSESAKVISEIKVRLQEEENETK